MSPVHSLTAWSRCPVFPELNVSRQEGLFNWKVVEHLMGKSRIIWQKRLLWQGRTFKQSRSLQDLQVTSWAEGLPVAPWQLCSGADSDPGSCGWRAQRWIDFILLPLPPDLWRAWETWGSLFWMINITPPPLPQFRTMLSKFQCRQLSSSLNKSGPREFSYSFSSSSCSRCSNGCMGEVEPTFDQLWTTRNTSHKCCSFSKAAHVV